ncbi:hypothetical protein MNBD_GAMMA05-1888 [hydrothermal vent metagenome]|uniref:Glycosyltransferase 2-like domain-containing protein n=1 Tax=hydrothermal vent metagenome TaxID=652676 RepID=A0A3B0WKA5_9ZZZZ
MSTATSEKIELSIIVPVSGRHDPVTELYKEYKQAVESTGKSFEFIYVLDGRYPEVLADLIKLQETNSITVITLAKWFGETTALNTAFKQASGDIFLTLPAYQQMEGADIPQLIKSLEDCDMVLARRYPRKDSIINRLQSRLFNFLLRFATDLKINDAGCSIRAFTRDIAENVHIYGDLHRFFPVIAHQHGYRIIETNVTQAEKDRHRRVYSPGIYIRRLLDLLTIFFLIKFTKKPLRFFGLVGTTLLAFGGLGTLLLIVQRLFFDMSLADRPALILTSLLVVLGVQIIAIGLIGEIIIFTHAKDIKEYKIDKIIN